MALLLLFKTKPSGNNPVSKHCIRQAGPSQRRGHIHFHWSHCASFLPTIPLISTGQEGTGLALSAQDGLGMSRCLRISLLVGCPPARAGDRATSHLAPERWHQHPHTAVPSCQREAHPALTCSQCEIPFASSCPSAPNTNKQTLVHLWILTDTLIKDLEKQKLKVQMQVAPMLRSRDGDSSPIRLHTC